MFTLLLCVFTEHSFLEEYSDYQWSVNKQAPKGSGEARASQYPR